MLRILMALILFALVAVVFIKVFGMVIKVFTAVKKTAAGPAKNVSYEIPKAIRSFLIESGILDRLPKKGKKQKGGNNNGR